jgi:hypothetical protein
MSDIQNLMISKLEKVEDNIDNIKITLVENTKDMKYHIKRTDDLQLIVEDLHTIVKPVYEEFIAKKAIKEYEKNRREQLVYRLKLPGYIVGAFVSIGSIFAYFWSR